MSAKRYNVIQLTPAAGQPRIFQVEDLHTNEVVQVQHEYPPNQFLCQTCKGKAGLPSKACPHANAARRQFERQQARVKVTVNGKEIKGVTAYAVDANMATMFCRKCDVKYHLDLMTLHQIPKMRASELARLLEHATSPGNKCPGIFEFDTTSIDHPLFVSINNAAKHITNKLHVWVEYCAVCNDYVQQPGHQCKQWHVVFELDYLQRLADGTLDFDYFADVCLYEYKVNNPVEAARQYMREIYWSSMQPIALGVLAPDGQMHFTKLAPYTEYKISMLELIQTPQK